MEKKKFSKEEKHEYFVALREEWQKSKLLAENDMEAEALFREAGEKGTSYNGFYFVYKQMKALKLEGLPYVDSKTFQGWRQNGFKVKKGEKSKIYGITWMAVKRDNKENKTDEDDIDYMYPKVYHLFHRSQVEEVEAKK
jgi:hypothetical protein